MDRTTDITSDASLAAHVANQTFELEEISKKIINPRSEIIGIQLDESNFFPWKYQISTAIKGYGLEEYNLETVPTPAKYITISEGQIADNKEYIIQQRQDSLLSAWLLSSISVNLLPQIIGCNTAREIWSMVEQIFSTQ